MKCLNKNIFALSFLGNQSHCHCVLDTESSAKTNLCHQAFQLAESGRSMVEMLSVLAIAGVLSVGGVVGYKYALNQYNTATTINDINLRRVILYGQIFPNYSLQEFSSELTRGYQMDAPTLYEGGFVLTIRNLPEEVCQGIYEHFFDETENILLFSENNQQHSCSENTTIQLFFNHTGRLAEYKCGDKYCNKNQQCYRGSCVDATCTSSYGCDADEAQVCRVFSDPSLNECVPACVTPTTQIGNCPCNSDKDCLDASGKPKTNNAKYCDFAMKRCVNCVTDDECPANQMCNMNGCINIECKTDMKGMNERACSTCDNFEWNGRACCPTPENTLYPFASLPSQACVSCGGKIQNDICVVNECQSDLSQYTDISSCQRCGGMWDLNAQKCIQSECQVNADCPNGYYCGAQSHYACYPVYNKCHKIDIQEFTITHNNQKEVWYYPQNAYNYWSLERACEAIGKSVPSIDELKPRWRSIYAVLNTKEALSSSTPSGSCSKYSISTSGSIYGTYHNTRGVCR